MTRPTANELQAMSNDDFARFLRRAGIAPARRGWSARFVPVLRTLLLATAELLTFLFVAGVLLTYVWLLTP